MAVPYTIDDRLAHLEAAQRGLAHPCVALPHAPGGALPATRTTKIACSRSEYVHATLADERYGSRVHASSSDGPSEQQLVWRSTAPTKTAACRPKRASADAAPPPSAIARDAFRPNRAARRRPRTGPPSIRSSSSGSTAAPSADGGVPPGSAGTRLARSQTAAARRRPRRASGGTPPFLSARCSARRAAARTDRLSCSRGRGCRTSRRRASRGRTRSSSTRSSSCASPARRRRAHEGARRTGGRGRAAPPRGGRGDRRSCTARPSLRFPAV